MKLTQHRSIFFRIAKRLFSFLFLLFWLALIGAVFYNTPYFSESTLKLLNLIPTPLDSTAANSQHGALSSNIDPSTGFPAWLKQLDNTNQQQQEGNTSTRLDADPSLLPITPYDPNSPVLIENELFDPAASDPTDMPLIKSKSAANTAQVIVVLGGGLTRDKQQNIVVNSFTGYRLYKALEIQKQTKLPLLLSGVEAPYMQKWLNAHHASAVYKEGASLNTCENARFTSLVLLKFGGTQKIHLVTDAYHMPRAKRLFAASGIDVIPHIVPLPQYMHQPLWPNKNITEASRRALYELSANIRDITIGQSACREVP